MSDFLSDFLYDRYNTFRYNYKNNELLDVLCYNNVNLYSIKHELNQAKSGLDKFNINSKEFEKKIAYEELATGGAMIIFNQTRDLLKDVVLNFIDFFIDESCGSCVPCRALTPVLKEKLEKIIQGNGRKQDISDLERLGKMMRTLNRCGLGQTAANPILTTIENFKEKYEALIKEEDEKYYAFDMAASVQESCLAVGRKPNLN